MLSAGRQGLGLDRDTRRGDVRLALRSYAENDAQRPLLEVKADTLLRRGDRRF